MTENKTLSFEAKAVRFEDSRPDKTKGYYERPVCTCGAVHVRDCSCEISMSDFLHSPGERRWA
jgi:hypothetical protein